VTEPEPAGHSGIAAGPADASGLVSDVTGFVFHRPEISTHVAVESDSWREDYTLRIAQRTGVDVSVYSILNIHRIGINAPVEIVFEEVERWNGESYTWPDHIATIEEIPGEKDGFRVVFLGRTRIVRWLRKRLGRQFGTLFRATVAEARRVPNLQDLDNARFFLWNCSGGYPLGVFSIFVRSAIPERGETEPTQVFFAVGFNPFGLAFLGRIGPVRTVWQSVHDSVTSNVLNRFKQQCEDSFRQLQLGVEPETH
jgi:hypothetical protein